MTLRAPVWIDIENPPQVQYLLPLAEALERADIDVVLTARDYGFTLRLLRDRGTQFDPVGREFGRKRHEKILGVVRRARALTKRLRQGTRPTGVVCSSRAAAIAARRLGIPSFVICDYEHAELSFYRMAGAYLIHPAVIDTQVFLEKGFDRSRLIPFEGLKEDITFSALDIDRIRPHKFSARDDLVRVLFRPPAENSHYYRSESGRLASQVLERLASSQAVVTIFSPRDASQADSLSALRWANPPIVLDAPLPFLELLTGVDLVISSGGTMLREAAWLGVPAYSIFQSDTGQVDQYLQSIGRLAHISSPSEFGLVPLVKRQGAAPTLRSDAVPERIVEAVMERVAQA